MAYNPEWNTAEANGAETMTPAECATQENTRDVRQSHLKPNERAALATLVERLRQRYGDDLLRVVLFGSKARSDSDESDLDVLVVVRMPDDDHWRHGLPLYPFCDLTNSLLIGERL